MTGISRYRCVVIHSVLFTYRFEYATSETYHYYFTDAEGNAYSSNTFWADEHFFVYNSNNPSVVRIRGS